MNRSSTALVVVVVLALAGCGSGNAVKSGVTAETPVRGSSSSSAAAAVQTPTTEAAEDATASANKIKGQVSSEVKVVTITENNDPNNKIGRPGGYTSAAVIYEKSVTCTDLGSSCGATIEVWGSQADARARAAFIQKSLKDIPILGTEYDYIHGVVLLRVVGVVKPSIAEMYNAAFGGVLFQ